MLGAAALARTYKWFLQERAHASYGTACKESCAVSRNLGAARLRQPVSTAPHRLRLLDALEVRLRR